MRKRRGREEKKNDHPVYDRTIYESTIFSDENNNGNNNNEICSVHKGSKIIIK